MKGMRAKEERQRKSKLSTIHYQTTTTNQPPCITLCFFGVLYMGFIPVPLYNANVFYSISFQSIMRAIITPLGTLMRSFHV